MDAERVPTRFWYAVTLIRKRVRLTYANLPSLGRVRESHSLVCFHRPGPCVTGSFFLHLAITEAKLIDKGRCVRKDASLPLARSFRSSRYRARARARTCSVSLRYGTSGRWKVGENSLIKLRVSRYETAGSTRDRAAQKCNVTVLPSKTRPRRSEETDENARIAMTSWNGGRTYELARSHAPYMPLVWMMRVNRRYGSAINRIYTRSGASKRASADVVVVVVFLPSLLVSRGVFSIGADVRASRESL